jgi:hypothetical protein
LFETMPTLRRRNSDPAAGQRAPLRSSLANAAGAVEDRIVWGAADVFRALFDAVKWPFERIAWAVEHWLIWPIQEETALWSRPVRAAVLAGVAVLAAAGIAAGVLVSDPSAGGDSTSPTAVETSAPAATPPIVPTLAPSKAAAATAATGPVLHGSSPKFSTESGGGVTKAEAVTEPPASQVAAESGAAAAADAGSKSAGSTAGTPGSDVVGPQAIAVAREFSGAFVLYETGHNDAGVRAIFHQTATPDLARALLKRPPRLPASVKVPKAKVLNIVAGPTHGDTDTVSVSLLRVGVTSELRLDMQKAGTAGGSPTTSNNGSESTKGSQAKWLVTDVLG